MMILRSLILTLFIKAFNFACAGGWDYNQKSLFFLENRKMPFSNIAQEINSANVYNTILWAYEEKNKEKI